MARSERRLTLFRNRQNIQPELESPHGDFPMGEPGIRKQAAYSAPPKAAFMLVDFLLADPIDTRQQTEQSVSE